jgi:hypothetical protein
MAALPDLCTGPLDPVCTAATGVVDAAGSAVSESILGGLGAAFVTAAEQVSSAALTVLDATTAVDTSASWLRANVAVLAAVTLPAVVGLFVLQVLTSVLRREPGGLARAVIGVAKAVLGAGFAVVVTQSALLATDQVCQAIAAASGLTVRDAAARFVDLTWLAGPSSGPVLQLVLGGTLIVGFLLLWGVLLFRKAALILVIVFAPVAFAGLAWDQTRVWARRWIEIVAALVLSKVVIVVVFVVGASAFSGTGPDAGTGSAPASETSGSLSDLLAGLLLLSIAVLAPWLTWRFVHWTGMEAASVMHGAVAAGPIPRTARAAGNQARFAAQSVATGMVLGPGGAAAGAGARAATVAAAGAASPSSGPVAPRRPAASAAGAGEGS